MTPFEEDTIVLHAALTIGYTTITRRPVVRIDAKLLPESLLRKTPDYPAIHRLLLDGRDVPGASLTSEVVYVLAKPAPEVDGRVSE